MAANSTGMLENPAALSKLAALYPAPSTQPDAKAFARKEGKRTTAGGGALRRPSRPGKAMALRGPTVL
jgi:hypothetical protein